MKRTERQEESAASKRRDYVDGRRERNEGESGNGKWEGLPSQKTHSLASARKDWLGHQDSNLGMTGIKIRCLTTWRRPNTEAA